MPTIQKHDFEFRISNFEFPTRLPLERSEWRGKGVFIGGAWHPDMTLSSTSGRRAWHPLGKCVRKREILDELSQQRRGRNSRIPWIHPSPVLGGRIETFGLDPHRDDVDPPMGDVMAHESSGGKVTAFCIGE